MSSFFFFLGRKWCSFCVLCKSITKPIGPRNLWEEIFHSEFDFLWFEDSLIMFHLVCFLEIPDFFWEFGHFFSKFSHYKAKLFTIFLYWLSVSARSIVMFPHVLTSWFVSIFSFCFYLVLLGNLSVFFYLFISPKRIYIYLSNFFMDIFFEILIK